MTQEFTRSNRRIARCRALAGIGVVLAAMLLSVGCRPAGSVRVRKTPRNLVPVVKPDPAKRIEAQLRGQAGLVPPGESLPAHLHVRFPPRPGVGQDLRLTVQTKATIRDAGFRTVPREVLDRPGLYLGVTRDDGNYAWLVRANDPRWLRAEYLVRGKMQAQVLGGRNGVISTRAPLVLGGGIELFEIDAGRRVSRVWIDERVLDVMQRSAARSPVSLLSKALTGIPVPPMGVTLWSNVFDFISVAQPHLHHVRGDATAQNPLNVLIVGDGFVESPTPDDLVSYRAAVHQLVERLSRSAPFCHYADALNFYRVDVHDTGGRLIPQDACPATSCDQGPGLIVDPSFVEPVPAPVVAGQYSPLLLDFEVEQCPVEPPDTVGICRVLWPTPLGQTNLYDLMNGYPAHTFALAVVIGNTRDTAGAGLYDTSTDVDRLVVTGVPLLEAAGSWSVSETGHNLFAHEFGHGMGLHDEYVDGAVDAGAPSLSSTANVWLPEDPLPWPPGGSPGSPSISWAGFLGTPSAPCSPAAMQACCGTDPGTGCSPCLPATATCRFVPAICNQDRYTLCDLEHPLRNLLCQVPDPCQQYVSNPLKTCKEPSCILGVSVFEGALYKPNGRYRAEYNCRMERLEGAHPFCTACLLELAEQFDLETGIQKSVANLQQLCTEVLIQDGKLIVKVYAEDGSPVTGATVILTSTSMSRMATTDAQGQALFIGLPPGSYTVRIIRSGFEETTEDADVQSGGAAVIVVVTLPPATP